MYIPQHYKNENLTEVKEFLLQNSFGILINTVEGKPWGTHIPLELGKAKDGKDVLTGHIAKANPQWHHFKNESEVLCIFNGPHSYISSSWYKEEEVPTWNYIAVHVYGTLKIIEGEALLDHFKKLVDKYEANSKNPIKIENLSKATMAQVRGVVGFEIEIKDIQATYKLSQTRTQDHDAIISGLHENNTPEGKAIAAEIEKYK